MENGSNRLLSEELLLEIARINEALYAFDQSLIGA